MDRYRLKNIIILILSLMNVFLLASLAIREGARQSAKETAVEQMVSLFAADGITLDPDVISDETPPASRSLTRSTDLERRAATLLLGTALSSSDQGGGISSYSSDRGAAQFRSGGSFDASGTLCQENPTDFCQDFCREFGYSKPVFQLDTNATGTGTAVFLCDGLSVYNCTLTFTITEGTLTSVSGTLVPQTYTELASDVEPLSASAALTAFQKVRRETSAVVSSVTELELCLEYQSSSTTSMTLIPAWCIVTNTGEYYVNCSTGTVTFGGIL